MPKTVSVSGGLCNTSQSSDLANVSSGAALLIFSQHLKSNCLKQVLGKRLSDQHSVGGEARTEQPLQGISLGKAESSPKYAKIM